MDASPECIPMRTVRKTTRSSARAIAVSWLRRMPSRLSFKHWNAHIRDSNDIASAAG